MLEVEYTQAATKKNNRKKKKIRADQHNKEKVSKKHRIYQKTGSQSSNKSLFWTSRTKPIFVCNY